MISLFIRPEFVKIDKGAVYFNYELLIHSSSLVTRTLTASAAVNCARLDGIDGPHLFTSAFKAKSDASEKVFECDRRAL